jgi:branched-chain amino acid transport system ATP-binding protein
VSSSYGSIAGATELSVEKVSKRFAGLQALDSVSLLLRPGEILGLIGPNGSGKSTLVNVVTGFLKPEAGRILVNGIDITGWEPRKIAPLGLARTFQTVRLFLDLTVIENVEVGAVSVLGMRRPEAKQRAYELLERLGIANRAEMRASELAYGDLRRTEVARALATSPNYLMLDEPAAGLNEAESESLREILASIPREFNLGMMIIDHEMRLIMRLCDRLHVLNYGATIGEGKPDEIRRNKAVVEAYLGTEKTEWSHASA